jgi:hypothetical protein
MPARWAAPTTFRLTRNVAGEILIHISLGTRTVCNKIVRLDGMLTAYGDFCPDCRAGAGDRNLEPVVDTGPVRP